MAHTIEEIREAKAALCKEIAKKIETFESQYDVSVEDVRYNRYHTEAINGMGLGSVWMGYPATFDFDIKL